MAIQLLQDALARCPVHMPGGFVPRHWDWGGNWRSTKDGMHFQYATGV